MYHFNSDALMLSANDKNGNTADLCAKITGSGYLSFCSQNDQSVSLSNRNNDYTAITDLHSGNLTRTCLGILKNCVWRHSDSCQQRGFNWSVNRERGLNIQDSTLDIAGDNGNLTANVNIVISVHVLVSHVQRMARKPVSNMIHVYGKSDGELVQVAVLLLGRMTTPHAWTGRNSGNQNLTSGIDSPKQQPEAVN